MRSELPAPSTGRVGCDVVVVDDLPELTTAIAEALGGPGLSVRVAFDGEGAVALARTYNPVVALIDCVLPDADGLHLIRELRKAWPDTAFIAMSGAVGGVSEDMARKLRIKAFLNKPLPMRALVQAVERLVRSPSGRPPEREAPSPWISLGIGSPASRGNAHLTKKSDQAATDPPGSAPIGGRGDPDGPAEGGNQPAIDHGMKPDSTLSSMASIERLPAYSCQNFDTLLVCRSM